MQVEELVEFLNWLDREVRQTRLVDQYQQLFNVLSQNSQPNVTKQPFENQRNTLNTAVLNVKTNELNDAQLRFAKDIGLLNYVGTGARDAIEDVLYRNAIDIATASQKINQFRTSLDAILQNMQQVSNGLSKYVKASPEEYGEALVHIRFQRNSGINNVVDLRKWGNAWYDIARGISMWNQLPPEDVRIIGASKGSIVYDIAVSYLVVNTLTGIILRVLKVAERVLDIRRKGEELRTMKLSNDEAAQALDHEAEKIEKEGHATVLAEMMAGKTVDGEQDAALSNAITKLFDFVSGGGEIDVHIKESTQRAEGATDSGVNNTQVIAEIKDSFKEIRQLEAKLLLLRDKNS